MVAGGLGLLFWLILIVFYLIISALVLPLPISDLGTVRYKSIPYGTLALISLNSLIFILWQAPDYYQAQTLYDLQPYVDKVWAFGYREAHLRLPASIGAFTTFTSMFMHADLWHLLGNMIFLWTFGRRLEDACGTWRFLVYYLTAGMVANLGSAALDPSPEDLPGIGASGAISGVMGAYLLLFPGAKVECLWVVGSILRIPVALILNRPMWRWTIALPAWLLLIYYAVRETLPSFEVMTGQARLEGVNHLAHLFGFLASILILAYVRKDLLTRYLAGRRL